jgi:hypothetical protein
MLLQFKNNTQFAYKSLDDFYNNDFVLLITNNRIALKINEKIFTDEGMILYQIFSNRKVYWIKQEAFECIS